MDARNRARVGEYGSGQALSADQFRWTGTADPACQTRRSAANDGHAPPTGQLVLPRARRLPVAAPATDRSGPRRPRRGRVALRLQRVSQGFQTGCCTGIIRFRGSEQHWPNRIQSPNHTTSGRIPPCKIDEDSDLPIAFSQEIIAAACALANTELTRMPSFEHDLSCFLGLMLTDFGHRSLILDAGIAALDWFGRGSETVEYTGLLARLAEVQDRSRQTHWWRERFASAPNSEERFLLSKTYLAWANDKVLQETIRDFSASLDKLSPAQFHALYEARSGSYSPYPHVGRKPLKPGFPREARTMPVCERPRWCLR